ncbi:Protein kinase [Spraguea lophii 42_110]|uniref:Protein kinase n=1 Tax=Spraguea lophii (strain 42_110) TaxID=1358809 RepID=S7W849_SPRLO|nr:Protein kinase [Spraguea lophii 42_110]
MCKLPLKNDDININQDDILFSNGVEYKVRREIGSGTFGRVFECCVNNKKFAVKVIKSDKGYLEHGFVEYQILKSISEKHKSFFVNVYDIFMYNNHLCIVQELLIKNLYELIRDNNFVGINYMHVQHITKQVLCGLYRLSTMGIIHCDLKPENIMISDFYSMKIKIIDFSSATTKQICTNFYAQSRYYRAPEVILGIPYNSSVDLWSLACIVYEMFIGSPLFPGKNNQDQLFRICSLLGNVPNTLKEVSHNHWNIYVSEERVYNTKQNFYNKINIKSMDSNEARIIIDFILYLLNINHIERPSVYEAKCHEFIRYIIPLREDIEERIITCDGRNHCAPSPSNKIERRNSITDTNVFESITKPLKNIRKTSVFEYNLNENRNNKDKK